MQLNKTSLKIVHFISILIIGDNTSLLGQVRDIRMEELLGRNSVKFNKMNYERVPLLESIGLELEIIPRDVIWGKVFEGLSHYVQERGQTYG